VHKGFFRTVSPASHPHPKARLSSLGALVPFTSRAGGESWTLFFHDAPPPPQGINRSERRCAISTSIAAGSCQQRSDTRARHQCFPIQGSARASCAHAGQKTRTERSSLRAAFRRTLDAACPLAVRPRLRLDSRRRHLNPRGGRRALAGREKSPHTLSLRGKSRSKVSNGVAAFAARGSSLDWQKSPQFARCLSDADR
jgi:hypothetical protein